ncbi:spondin domain-containing protein [Psychromonas sp. L1A2]|uniref:spondin domain-containing protein n=1 Tax=Psychromonas sp. L1A2 TaxID=2686356 RepID=UPI001359820C|nr:spondin domain-containing protein [Psychromonas sp. L1A2]
MLKKHLIAVGLFGLFSATSQAQDLTITVTNLTHGIYFTPVITAAHDADTAIFTTTEAASAELEALAEGGDISGVSGLLSVANADVNENPAGGLLAPATSANFSLSNNSGNDYLSVAAMMLPTNDGFIGLDSWEIPTEAGTYTVYLNAYDAGTEANDEIIANIPNPIGITATGASGVTEEISNPNVHIHPGVLGDDDEEGGISDLDNSAHRWLNPVAKLTIVVE